MTVIAIGGHELGPGKPPMIVAEIGNNHNGGLALAQRMVRSAADSGAHAVKFQTYRTDHFLSRECDYFEEFHGERLGYEDQSSLFSMAESLGMEAFATPFDAPSLDFLVKSARPAIKIASCDLTSGPLLEAVGGTGRPVILSTGAGRMKEVESAMNVLDPHGDRDVILLHCTVSYPARDEDANLRRMERLRDLFGRPVGFSDHTEGVDISLGAVALGAVMIEKHFTVDRSLPGGDNDMSILPGELAALVAGSRRIAMALGTGRGISATEEGLREVIRRSPTAVRSIKAGERLTEDNVVLMRPGSGLSAGEYSSLIGRIATVDIDNGVQIKRKWVK